MFPSNDNFDAKIALESVSAPLSEDLPFHILFLGDWSGRENSISNANTPSFRPIEIDRDNFEDVLRKLNVKLDLDFQGNGENVLSLEFKELEDFHPDKIFQNLPLFANLRDVRRKLLKESSFNEAAHEVRSWLVNSQNTETTKIETSTVSSTQEQSSPDDLLNQILAQAGGNESTPQSQTTVTSELSSLIANLVQPHLIRTDAAEQSELLLIVDEIISDLMRKILHHTQFQSLESAWRGIFLLIKRVETDTDLKMFLLDISKSELIDDLKSVSDLEDSKFYKTVNDDSVQPWAFIGGNYDFKLNINDIATLMRLGKIASVIDAPFISYIDPESFGVAHSELSEDADVSHNLKNLNENKLWATLRSVPEAAYLGLTTPRFLLRLPYGQKTEPTETFNFEEFSLPSEHKNYLWGNPSFVYSIVFAQNFMRNKWNFMQNFYPELDGMPIHLYEEYNQTKTKSCTEFSVTRNNCERLIEDGIMPIIIFRNSDKIRLADLSSVAFPVSTLQGKWINGN